MISQSKFNVIVAVSALSHKEPAPRRLVQDGSPPELLHGRECLLGWQAGWLAADTRLSERAKRRSSTGGAEAACLRGEPTGVTKFSSRSGMLAALLKLPCAPPTAAQGLPRQPTVPDIAALLASSSLLPDRLSGSVLLTLCCAASGRPSRCATDLETWAS